MLTMRRNVPTNKATKRYYLASPPSANSVCVRLSFLPFNVMSVIRLFKALTDGTVHVKNQPVPLARSGTWYVDYLHLIDNKL